MKIITNEFVTELDYTHNYGLVLCISCINMVDVRTLPI